MDFWSHISIREHPCNCHPSASCTRLCEGRLCEQLTLLCTGKCGESLHFLLVNLFWEQMSCLAQFSCSIVSYALRPHGLQYSTVPCSSPTPGAYSNSCALSRWCHPTSHPLSSPSPSTFNLSQHQGLFQWVSFSHQVAKVLKLQLQHQFFQWVFRTDFL